MKTLFLTLIVLALPAFAEVESEFSIQPGSGTATYRVTVPVGSSYAIENRLGNVDLYPVDGNELVLTVDGLRHASEEAKLRVWEPESTKLIIDIDYPKKSVSPPEGNAAEWETWGTPADGIVRRNNVIVLAGRMTIRNNAVNVGSPGAIKVNGVYGETHLTVGVPRSIMDLKIESMTGDISVRDLSKVERFLQLESSAGNVTLKNIPDPAGLILEGFIIQGNNALCNRELLSKSAVVRSRINYAFDFSYAKME